MWLLETITPAFSSRMLPDLAEIHQELKGVGVTLQLLWEEYREVHGESGYGKLRPSMRQVHRAGEKLFVGTLGASCYTYAEATATQKLRDWLGAYERMVEYFGGSAAIWVPDQLKDAIAQPCRYEPAVKRTYHEMASHYGVVVIPARPRKPRDKAKVETMVLVAQRWILARLSAASSSSASLNEAIGELEQLNAHLIAPDGETDRKGDWVPG